jgi:SAM-dependent methyltransferase
VPGLYACRPMDVELRNLLYRRPELYERVYHGSGDAVPKMCERLFERHLDCYPASLLDIGCGTGRDLAFLAERSPECVGVDIQEGMIAFARERREHIDFRVGDMRSVRVGRTFEAITCMGIAIANLHTDQDLAAAFATFAAHSQAGTLLVLEALNALNADAGGGLARRFVIDTPELKASADATYQHDRRRQLLERRRVWTGMDAGPVEDFVRFRTVAPRELEHHLAWHGFETLDMYGDRELTDTDLDGITLMVSARFVGSS